MNHRWVIHKADVRKAFLQGKPFPEDRRRQVYLTPELAEALGGKRGDIGELLKAAYGLSEAPAEWYVVCDEALASLAARKMLSDPCVWTFVDNGEQYGQIGAHVDDFFNLRTGR